MHWVNEQRITCQKTHCKRIKKIKNISKDAFYMRFWCVSASLVHAIEIYEAVEGVSHRLNHLLPSVLYTARLVIFFNFRRDHQKNFLRGSRLWVGRRKEPIIGYVTKNEENKNWGSRGLKPIIIYDWMLAWLLLFESFGQHRTARRVS